MQCSLKFKKQEPNNSSQEKKLILYIYIYIYMWSQRIWVPRPISNNKPKGPAEE